MSDQIQVGIGGPAGSPGVTLHAQLTDSTTSGHPASAITGLAQVVVPLQPTVGVAGIHRNTDSATYGQWFTIGTYPNSMGFAGQGTPAEAYAPFVGYQEYGDKIGLSNAPILKTTQGSAFITNYWGPTVDDSAQVTSFFGALKNTGTPYTQTKQFAGYESHLSVEGANNLSEQATPVGARFSNGTGTVEAVSMFRTGLIINAGTINTWYGFRQSMTPPGTVTTKYGAYLIDQVVSETAFSLGKSAFSGSLNAKLLGNGDSSDSMLLLNLPTTADVPGSLTGIRIQAAADQIRRLQEWWAGGGAGSASTYIAVNGGINTRVPLVFTERVEDPLSPIAPSVRLYQRSASSGNGELVALFPTGLSKVIAGEDGMADNSFGIITNAAGVVGTQAAWATANDASYARVLVGGSISNIGFHVSVSSGNVSVAVYRNSGSGRSAVPGTRLATSGAVACPGTGFQTISLGSTVAVQRGDWIALSCDNTTAAFTMVSNIDSDLYLGFSYRQSTSHPLPSTPASLVASTSRQPILIGT